MVIFQDDAGDSLGNWQGNMFQMLYNYGTIYSVTFTMPDSFAGNNYEYKFVITPDEIWEIDPNRIFSLNSPSIVVGPYYFNYDSNITIIEEVTNTINFTADITSVLGVGINGAFDPYQDSLLVMGLDWNNLGMNVVGNRRMENTDPFNPGIYTTSLAVTSGSAAPDGEGDSTKWKFVAYPDYRFSNSGWEFGADRWYFYETDGAVVDLPIIVPRILPAVDILNHTVDLTIHVDMTGAVNIFNGEPIPIDSIEHVIISGSVPFLGMYGFIPPSPPYPCYCIDDTTQGYVKILTHSNANIWTFHTTIPVGQPCGVIEYKFGVTYPGYDTINGGTSTILNELQYPDMHNFILTNSLNSIVRNNYFGDLGTPPAVEKIENLIPQHFVLEQNYPNPFNPSTKIRYSILEQTNVRLTIYNLLGELISTLVNGEQRTGVYEATFDATNFSSGIYFYTLQTKNFTSTKKMMLIK